MKKNTCSSSTSKNNLIRVRFAPSPTGWLHLGGARTALINYLFAKNQKGTFILRVEDTDLERGKDTFLKQQLNDLKWLGLDWDEGPQSETLKDQGAYAPYRQSQRLTLYQKYAKELVKAGKAYYCFLTEKEIQHIKDLALKKNTPPRVKSPFRDSSLEQAEQKLAKGESAVIRFKVSEVKKTYVLKDIVRGEISFPSDMVGDFVLIRSSGLPVYNFASAVDDYSMKISHIFRGDEHLANTLRQLMIFEAFNWKAPLYGHLSLILGEDRKKLSKRHGSVSVGEYKKQGYLAFALCNFLALMGWNPKTEQEIFSVPELVKCFSLKGLNASPGVFDIKKLNWINNQHLKNKTDEELWKELQVFFKDENLELSDSLEWRKKAIQSLRDSFTSLPEAVKLFRLLSKNHFKVDETAKEVLNWPSTSKVLKEWKSFLESFSDKEISQEVFLEVCKKIQKKTGLKAKFLFMPIRTAVLGKAKGVELKTIIPLISPDILLKRVNLLENSLKSS